MNRLLLFSFILTAFTASTQHDYQWMIFKDELKNGTSGYSGSSTTSFKIQNVKRPNSNNSLDVVECNDFFIIYNDGTYYLSDRPNTCSVPTISTLTASERDHIYNISTNAIPDFFYLTNRYENDDPKDRVIVEPGSTTTNSSYINIVSTTSINGIQTHHSPVNGADVVFIIENKECNYSSLCIPAISNGLTFTSSPFDQLGYDFSNGESNNMIIIRDGEFIYTPVDFELGCLPLPSTFDRLFIKFRASMSDGFEAQEVTYTLNNENWIEGRNDENPTVCDPQHYTEFVTPDSHDPNYQELKCVWMDEDESKWGIYRLACYNDGQGQVTRLKMKTNLPSFIDPNHDIEILNWESRCIDGCGTSSTGLENISTSANLLEVQFSNGLDSYNLQDSECKYSAFFEFKVKYINSVDIVFDDLSLNGCLTNFDGDDYSISTFIQDLTSYTSAEVDSLVADNLTSVNIRNKDIVGRTVNNCNYDCPNTPEPECPWWLWLLGGLIIGGIWYFLRKNRG